MGLPFGALVTRKRAPHRRGTALGVRLQSARFRLRTVHQLIRALGFVGMARVIGVKATGRPSITVKVKGVIPPVVVRMNNSDLPSVTEILCSDECEVTLTWRPKTVLDLGANIGFTAIKLNRQFPQARLIAVEPDWEAAEVCRLNTAHMSDVSVMHAAIGYTADFVRCLNPAAPNISRRFGECSADEKGAVLSVPILRLIDENACEAPILVKMDIEGAESECFAHADSWLPRVNGILVEPHSFDIEIMIRERLLAHGFAVRRVGEKIFGERL